MTPAPGCWKSKALETQCFTEAASNSPPQPQSQQAYLFFQGLLIIEYLKQQFTSPQKRNHPATQRALMKTMCSQQE